MSQYSYPVRVSADGVAAIRNPDATGSEDIPWLITDNSPGTDADVEGWTPYISFDKVGAAVFADALNEWATHWPPRKDDDVTLEPIYAALDELTPEQLEQIAIAASALSQRCWEVRGPKLVEESRQRLGITWASVNVEPTGPLRADSVVTIDNGPSAPVPERTQLGMLGGQRLAVALKGLGYEPINLSDGVLEDGVIRFLVRKVPAGE